MVGFKKHNTLSIDTVARQTAERHVSLAHDPHMATLARRHVEARPNFVILEARAQVALEDPVVIVFKFFRRRFGDREDCEDCE